MITGSGSIIAAISGLETPSTNEKTGPVPQVYIIRDDMTPNEAVQTGQDDAICGSCSLRGVGTRGRACYVQWWRGPTWVHKRTGAGLYMDISHSLALVRAWSEEVLAGRVIRLGAYGDPAAVPFEVWDALIHPGLSGWLGYTHQWKTCDPRFRRICMASADSKEEKAEAVAAGWRTFRVRGLFETELDRDEITCPASEEAGHRTNCQKCRLCQGMSRQAKSIAIYPHGTRTYLYAQGMFPFWEGKGKVRALADKPKALTPRLVRPKLVAPPRLDL
jgi:hypothetical protein